MRSISRWFEISPDNGNVHRAAAFGNNDVCCGPVNVAVISLKLGPASWVPKATRSVSSILKPEPVAVLFAHSGCYPKGGFTRATIA